MANAVLDGADAVMLSGETSVGAYPIDAVETMARIIESTEVHGLAHMATIDWTPETRGGIIAKAAAEVAARSGARYIVAFTQSGDSARRLAMLRNDIPVLAFTPESSTRSQLAHDLGSGDVPDRRRRAHRRDGPPGRRAAVRRSAASSRATPSSSSPAARPASQGPPTPCASIRWATPSTRSPRRTGAADSASCR